MKLTMELGLRMHAYNHVKLGNKNLPCMRTTESIVIVLVNNISDIRYSCQILSKVVISILL